MILRKAPRRAGELFAAETAEHPAELPARDDGMESFMVIGDVASQGVEVFRKRHIQAAANQ